MGRALARARPISGYWPRARGCGRSCRCVIRTATTAHFVLIKDYRRFAESEGFLESRTRDRTWSFCSVDIRDAPLLRPHLLHSVPRGHYEAHWVGGGIGGDRRRSVRVRGPEQSAAGF